ncbi:MAG: DHH family phosphoesterase [Candidatus Diapherotrites archaeon]|nr:DHH family phosphoesterase [Candidatus Diapherotrites archaeon]
MSKKAVSLIKESNSFLLLPHRSPDIDSIASAAALALALKRRKKKVTISAEGAVNGQIADFASVFGLEITEPDFSVDCIIVLDTNSPSLFDLDSVKKSKAKKILIDHHSPKDGVMKGFDECIIDEAAVSTTQIIYSLLKEMDEPLTKETALAVCAGIVTDSANFIAATPEAFGVLAESLTETKASFQEVLKLIAAPREQAEKIARLKGAQRLKITREGGYIIVASHVSSFEGSVARSLLRLGADVSFVAAAKEGEARISARARDDLVKKGLHLGRDILPSIAELIGGDAGGHAAAAGANGVNPDALDDALSICVSKTQKFIKTL